MKGENSINIPSGGGIVAIADLEFVLDGNLSIEAGGENYDAVTTLGSITVKSNLENKQELIANAAVGVGLCCDGAVTIDAVSFKSKAFYAAIDAGSLFIRNNSYVDVKATDDFRNAIFVGSEEATGEIVISKTEMYAES